MLHVLRHYLPLQKALLVASELVLLTLVVAAGMSAHLWPAASDDTLHRLALQSLSVEDARWQCVLSALLVAALCQVAIAFNELYDFRISSSRFDRAARFLGSAGSAILLTVVAVGLVNVWNFEGALDFPGLPFSQELVVLIFTLMVGFALLYAWRHCFHWLLRKLDFSQRILVVGSGRTAERLVVELAGRAGSGYAVVGHVTPPGASEGRPAGERRRWPRESAGPSARGSAALAAPAPPALAVDLPTARLLDEPLYELARRLRVDDVVIALEDRRGVMPTQELLDCRLRGIAVEEAESLYERVTGKIAVEAMRPSYLIFNPGFVQHPLARAAKRAFDALGATATLAAALPAMVAVAIAIRLDSPGPILFRQERVGRFGEVFTLLKFRSMRHDAERETGPVWAQRDDPRVTRVGRFLRRSRLDELPQLLNVLAGSMSLVGPRPERPNFVADLAEKIPYYGQRHIVRPGVTGWAQINYPYGNTFEDASQKLQYDLFYIKHQSTIFDLSIVFNTIKTVVLRKGT